MKTPKPKQTPSPLIHPTVVIQEIQTLWTKESRGGPAATVRNAVPEGATIPVEKLSLTPDTTLIYQYLIYREWSETRFDAPARETIFRVPMPNPHFPAGAGCVLVGRTSDSQAFATFRYSRGLCGEPDRTWANKTLVLTPGQWVQIVYNGRFNPGESGWHYEKTVVNVGLFLLPITDGALFTGGEPAQRFSAMAHLL